MIIKVKVECYGHPHDIVFIGYVDREELERYWLEHNWIYVKRAGEKDIVLHEQQIKRITEV